MLNKPFLDLFKPPLDDMPSRRYDLDWLRVIVFGLLILFHVGMLYVANWGYHIKSQYLSEGLANVMLMLSPWRMAVLWLISGIAIRFILAKVTLSAFVGRRSLRLLLPLLFAILVIIPPQLYYEMTFNGDLNLSYWQFYQAFFDSESKVFADYQAGIWPHIDVNHLWYLRELWQYSLYLVLLLPFLNSHVVQSAFNALVRQSAIWIFLLGLIPIFVIQITVESDQVRYPLGFMFLIYGYLIGWNRTFWQSLKDNVKPLVLLSILLYLAVITLYQLVWKENASDVPPWLTLLGSLIYSAMRLVCALTVLGLAHKYLNQPRPSLSYLSEAVYPYYIVHQTIIITVCFELTQLKLGGWLEPVLVIFLTFALCGLSFELIKRVEILRVLFGLKLKGRYSQKVQRLGRVIAAIVIIPFGLEILI